LKASISAYEKNTLIVTQSMPEIEQAIQHAHGKPILLDFYADWCTSCKIIAATTLQNTHVQKALDHFLVVKVDLTANNNGRHELLDHFNVIAPPTFVFLDPQGNELEQLRIVGEVSSTDFLNHLEQAGSNHEP
jgi:thiol:disulfide interchange protein DsbD